jgi:hypothetical protein
MNTLVDLVHAVDYMCKKLPSDISEDVVNDLEALIKETKRKKPRKKWYQLSVEGLVKAAENVGKIGEPVIELAAKIIPMLMTLS